MQVHQADLEFVKKLLEGDELAFNDFYSTYFPRLFRFCSSRLEDKDSTRDVVQQVMINAMRGLQHYRGEASLFTWLCQIARHEISSWFRKVGRQQHMTSSLDEPGLLATVESLTAGFDELPSVHEDVLKSLVQTSLDALPTAYGSALEMKYIEGLSVQEIASQLSITEIAVQSILARARKAFKSVFSDLEKDYQSI